MIDEALLANGFTEKQAAIYRAALECGEATVARIAERSHLKRTTVYTLLPEMERSGLISTEKRRGTLYVSPLPPAVLIERCKRASKLAEDALPELMALADIAPLKPRLRLYEGMKGIEQVLLEFGGSKEPTHGFTDYERMPREVLSFLRSSVVPLRRKTGVIVRLIAPQSDINLRMQSHDAALCAEHQLLPIQSSTKAAELLLFGGSKIAFLSFDRLERFGAVLDSPSLYHALLNTFTCLWSMSATKNV